MKKTTIVDIAKRAGVSKGTVSAVINGKDSVRPETRERVSQVMKELNFQSKGSGRTMKDGGHDKSIGIIVKDMSYPFYTTIASGAREYASKKGYSVILGCSEDNYESEKKLSHLFSAKDIKGTIIAPVMAGTAEIEHLFKLRMINYPFVLLEDVKGIRANVVTIDNLKAIKKAVTYLIESGHTRIVHFAGPPQSSHTQERIKGFRHAFSESTLAFNEDMIVPIGSHPDECFSKTIEHFRNKKKAEYPTAIVCFNDHQALAVMTALNELNIRVPDDISIVGNDDTYYSSAYPVLLTTIRAPKQEIGKKAAEILIRNIESTTTLPVERVVLDTELVIRKSTRVLTPQASVTGLTSADHSR